MKTSAISSTTILTASAFAIVGLGLRILGLPLVSLDMQVYLLGWYDALAGRGWAALGEAFANYTPPYLYLMGLAALTQGFLPKVTAIKFIAVIFDLLNAFLVYKVIRFERSPSAALLGAAGFLLLPTILVNSAWWGQADAVYTFFLLTCLYFLMRGLPLPAMLALGVSFAFKAQAVFLGPLILLLMLRRKIPWAWLTLVPAVYVLMMLPAFLAGRPLPELLTIYLGQVDHFEELSKNAPNLYAFIPDAWYGAAVPAGIAVAALALLLWTFIQRGRVHVFTPRILLACALVSVVLAPTLLPKMHDRYFYPADLLSYLLAFIWPGVWLPAVAFQVISGVAYFVFLSGMSTAQGAPYIQAAAIVNTALIVGLLVWQYRRAADPQPAVFQGITQD